MLIKFNWALRSWKYSVFASVCLKCFSFFLSAVNLWSFVLSSVVQTNNIGVLWVFFNLMDARDACCISCTISFVMLFISEGFVASFSCWDRSGLCVLIICVNFCSCLGLCWIFFLLCKVVWLQIKCVRICGPRLYEHPTLGNAWFFVEPSDSPAYDLDVLGLSCCLLYLFWKCVCCIVYVGIVQDVYCQIFDKLVSAGWVFSVAP